MEVVKKILLVLGKDGKKEFVIQFFLMIIAAALEVIGIGSIPVIMRYIIEPERLKNIPWLYDKLQQYNLLETIDLFVVGAIVVISVFIVKNVYRLFVDYRQIRIVKDVQIDLATNLFNKYLFSSYIEHLKKNTSVLIRNIQNEVIYITSKVLVPFFLILLNITILAGFLISLLIAQPVLTLIILAALIIFMGLFNLAIKKKLIGYGKVMQYERKNQLQYLYQGLQGFKAIKVANREAFFMRLFEKTTKKFANIQQRVSILNKLPVGYLEVVSILIIFLIVGTLLGLDYTGNELTYLVSFFGLALVKMRQNISVIMTNIGLIRTNQVSFDPVLEDLLETAEYSKSEVLAKTDFTFNKSITFEKVSFSYGNKDEKVFDSLSLKIDKGEIIGIVGATGGGKSTLVDILLGLIKPQSGEVKVDDTSIFTNVVNWQKKIGYVPQSIYLLNDSIKKNITFGIKEKNINDELLAKVIELAQLNDFIDTLPKGINTEVGENGARISGGQRQRIGIARALYMQPEILILDEATSALDNITEQKFIDILENLRANMTIVMIAHRLTTLKDCDNIFYLEKGVITASGNFNQLLNNSQGFKDLANGSF